MRASRSADATAAKDAGIAPVQSFPALCAATPWARHAFVLRVPGISTKTDRAEAMARLKPAHASAIGALGFNPAELWTAEQVHGAEVKVVPPVSSDVRCIAGVDGLITATPGCLLGIYVADCGPIFVADTRKQVLAVLHSGKKGTELGILSMCLKCMEETFATDPADVVVQLGPCIRPPNYEVNFAARIVEQATEVGVPPEQVNDCGICTAQHLDCYYSYRAEKGKTGRMLALFGLPVQPETG